MGGGERCSFVSGEGRRKWELFLFCRWVVFISGCSDAMVTSPAENKPVAPGSLPRLCSSSPRFSARYWDSNRKQSEAERWCGLATERTSSQSLRIWARAESLPITLKKSAVFWGIRGLVWFGFSSTRSEGKVKATHLVYGEACSWQRWWDELGSAAKSGTSCLGGRRRSLVFVTGGSTGWVATSWLSVLCCKGN